MNAFAWTSIIMLSFFALGAFLLVARWLLERMRMIRQVRAAILTNAGQIALCCAIGLLAALLYFWGFTADAKAHSLHPTSNISNR